MTTTRFFVYGSMSEGMVHFNKIQSFIESSVPARIKAKAYRLKVGFPTLTDEGDDLVEGHLVEIRSTDLLIALLDEFYGYNPQCAEKSLYSRKEVAVDLSDTTDVTTAWVYFLNPNKLPLTATVIEGGDWRSSLVSEPALTSKLTERQITYIQKLGKSTGREIVPIDLNLYRELMNLELIVDKGRRLALSKFGQEVYRHLG